MKNKDDVNDLFRRAEELGGELTLTEKDLQELQEGTCQVYDLMKGGQWHTPDEIRDAAGGGSPASEGLRRMRELREYFVIEKVRSSDDKRLWKYRLSSRIVRVTA